MKATKKMVKYFTESDKVCFIETDNAIISIDIFDDGSIPADLSRSEVYFHLMEFSTRSHIWSKKCNPIYDAANNTPNFQYPYTVPVIFENKDTDGLNGHYIGQLELIDHNGNSKFPFQIEIIICKKASL